MNLTILGQNKNKTIAHISFQLDSPSPQSTISFGVTLIMGSPLTIFTFLRILLFCTT